MMGVHQELATELSRIAGELRPVGAAYVSVVGLAERVGAKVFMRFHSAGRRRDAEVEFGGGRDRIVLFRQGSNDGEKLLNSADECWLTARERFSIAHELAHWISFRRLGLTPGGRSSEFWDQERCMDAFANSLLVPDWLVERWLSQIPANGLIEPLMVRRCAAMECRVSEEVVARALCRPGGPFGLMKLVSAREKATGNDVLRVLFSVCGGGLCLPKVHAHIANEDLRQALEARKIGAQSFRACRLGKCPPQDLRIAWRHAGSLGRSPSAAQQAHDQRLSRVFWLSLCVESSPTPGESAQQLGLL